MSISSMEKQKMTIFVYIQPISVSLLTQHSRIGTIFKGDNHLQVDAPKFFSSKTNRPPLKLRDLVKINKEYKVYNSVINFYNFLYEIEIQKNALPLLDNEIIKVRLQSKGEKGDSRLRSYDVEIKKLLEDLETEKISVSRESVLESGEKEESELTFNVVTSSDHLSLISLQQLLQDQNSELTNQLEESGEHPPSFILKIAQSPSGNQMLSTLASEDWGNGQTRISRTTNDSHQSGQKQSRKLIKTSELKIPTQKDFLKVEEAGDCSMRKSRADEEGVSNTNYYDQSPKFKRLYRLRRSCVLPSSVHCEMDEIDPKESFFKVKQKFTIASHYLLLILGLGLIYLMMHPSRRV